MRVPVVIALVLAGVAALFFALSGGDTTQNETPAVQSGGITRPTAEADLGRTEELSLVDTSAPQRAERREAREVPSETTRDAVEQSGNWATAIEGVVVDPQGNLLAGAKVVLRDDNQYGSAGNLAPFFALTGGIEAEPETWSTTTDEEGAFAFYGMDPGDSYTLLAQAEGFARKEVQRVRIVQGETVREEIKLDKGFMIAGYVRDIANGSLIYEAELTLIPLTFAQFAEDDPQFLTRVRTETSREDGYYAFENVSPDMYMLTAKAEGFGSVSMNDVQVGNDRGKRMLKRDFNLEGGDLIAGQAFSRAGVALEGVRVVALSQGGQKQSRGAALTDEEGRFVMRDLVPGTYTVVGTKPGWEEGRQQRVETGDSSVRLELTQQGGVAGRVLTPDGRALTSFTAKLRMLNQHTNTPGRPMRTVEAKSVSDGSFEIRGIPKGRYVVEVEGSGFAPSKSEHFEVNLGQLTTGIEIRMTYGGGITGRIVDAATVTTFDNTRMRSSLDGIFGLLMPRTTTERSARSGPDGVFSLELLSPDVYQIEVSHRDYYAVVENDVNVIGRPEPTDVGTIRMSPGATLAGTAYDASGAPLVGGTVTVANNPEAPGLTYEGRTGSDGRYRIENILPGSYQVHAQRPVGAGSGSPFDVVVDIQNSKVNVFLREGREQLQDLSLGN